ncbi:MAG: FeoC-like transcriptional regulator [Candidatus Thorarchaeota archaeon]|nr:FeoC-like transcriptional regulator [Candidatus Thorarchaeota archaeon]
MIGTILKTMMEDRIITTRDLAQEVGVQPETLGDILVLLVRRGLIEEVATSCDIGSTCKSCPMYAACTRNQREGRTFKITKRGVQHVRKTRG